MTGLMVFYWLIGGNAVPAAGAVGLFWAAIARPSPVRRPTMFRVSALVLGLSTVANVLVPITLLVVIPDDGRARNPTQSALLYLLAVPPLLTMAAIYLGLVAVMDDRARPADLPAVSG